MNSLYQLQRLADAYNEAGVERQRVEAANAGALLRSIGMTPAEMVRYQARVAGIGERLEEVTSRMRKPPRLFR